MFNYLKWYFSFKNIKEHLVWWFYVLLFFVLAINTIKNTMDIVLTIFYAILCIYSLYIKYIEYYLYKIPIINGDTTDDILDHIRLGYFSYHDTVSYKEIDLLNINDIYKLVRKPKNMFKYKEIIRNIIFEDISNKHIKKYEYAIRDMKLKDICK